MTKTSAGAWGLFFFLTRDYGCASLDGAKLEMGSMGEGFSLILQKIRCVAYELLGKVHRNFPGRQTWSSFVLFFLYFQSSMGVGILPRTSMKMARERITLLKSAGQRKKAVEFCGLGRSEKEKEREESKREKEWLVFLSGELGKCQ